MVLGVFLILLACLLNAVVILIPGTVAYVITGMIVALMHKLKLRNYTIEQFMFTSMHILSLLFAASLQVFIWQLLPGEEGWRWTLANLAFVIGTGCVLLFKVSQSQSPFDRAWSARRFMIGVILFSATLGVSFSNVNVYVFVRAAPGEVLRFMIGELPKK